MADDARVKAPRVKQAMAEQVNTFAPIVQRIASASKPVISDDMTLLIRAGRNVAFEPRSRPNSRIPESMMKRGSFA